MLLPAWLNLIDPLRVISPGRYAVERLPLAITELLHLVTPYQSAAGNFAGAVNCGEVTAGNIQPFAPGYALPIRYG